MKAKTINTTIHCSPQRAIAFLSDPQNLPRWHRAFCRSVRREGEGWMVQTHRKTVPLQILRDDRSGVVDFLFKFDADFEWLVPSRVLANGNGSELVLTLIQPDGTSDADYHRHLQWAFDALRDAKKLLEQEQPAPTSAEVPTESVETTDDSEKPERRSEETPIPTGPVSAFRLFVRGFPMEWTENQLREHFTASGTVSKAEVARFRRTGKSRGFGFIEMATEEETHKAIQTINGSMIGTRTVTVRLSRESLRAANGGASDESQENPGNEAVAPTEVPKRHDRPRRSARHEGRRDGRPNANERGPQRRRLPGGTDRNAVIETGGYEFFPRGQKSESPEPGNVVQESRRQPPYADASPYFEDTGDIENRGNRAPARRGGPRNGNRGPRGRGRSRSR